MILRPSKIFVSFHQLRYYFQTKISELVATSSHQQQPVTQQLANFSTTQQSILFFSDIQRSLIQKAYYCQPVKRNPINEKLLLKVIQQHFPIVKVFSQPTLHSRMWTTTALPTQQLRTMMSSSGGGGTTFTTWGFPRTAMVGVGRSNGFAATTRQFSTTKSTHCVTLFQNTTPQQPNVFAHISSRIFSPAGTKMNNPPSADEKPKYVPFYSLEKDMSSDDESVCSSSNYSYNRMFQQKTNKGIGELFVNNENEQHRHVYVRRESTTCRNSNKRSTSAKKLESIIRHDDISSLHNGKPTTVNNSNKRKLRSSSSSTTRHGRIKHPPDQQQQLHHVKKKPTTIQDNTTKSRTTGSVYLLITLDSVPFLETWSTTSLNSCFIDSVETLANNYQLHIHHVLHLLDRLRYSGKKFRVVARNSELRIYFPSFTSIGTKSEAIQFLKRLDIDQDEAYYSIVVEDEGDYFSLDHHADTATNVVGPDYFKDLQMFLDRTDYLIETSSSAFSSSR